jgi:hypothetical protein
MLSFSNELIYAIFMNYEKVFKYPTNEECLQEIEDRLNKQSDITLFANRMRGNNIITKDEIYQLKINDIEDRIEKEIEKVKVKLIKEKLKRFPLLVRVIQDVVHSTYNRALNGQERASLRLHMTMSENKGYMPQPMMNKNIGGFFGWGKK